MPIARVVVFHCKKPREPEAYKVAASGILLHVPHSHSDFPLPRLSQNTEHVGQRVGPDHTPLAGLGICSHGAGNTGGVCVSVCEYLLIVWRLWYYEEESSIVLREMLMWQILESLSSHCRAWCHVNCFATAALDASDSFCRRSRCNKAEAAEVCPWHFKHAWETHQAANENEMVQESFGSIDHLTFVHGWLKDCNWYPRIITLASGMLQHIQPDFYKDSEVPWKFIQPATKHSSFNTQSPKS